MLKHILTATAAISVMAIQVQAATLFTEDFETHNSGHSLNGINGWSSVGNPDIAEVLVNNIPGVMDENYGDGTFRFTPSDGGKHVNSAGIAGGMDPIKEYRLSWTWKRATCGCARCQAAKMVPAGPATARSMTMKW